MITVLIIEDEPANAAILQKMLLQLEEEIVVTAVLQTVRESIKWLGKEKSLTLFLWIFALQMVLVLKSLIR